MKKATLLLITLLLSTLIFSQNFKELNTSSFKSKIWNFTKNKTWKFESSKPAIVYFYTDWSSSCKKTNADLNAIQKQFAQKINFYKVNSDDAPIISVKLGISGVPAIIFIKPGQKFTKSSGKISSSDIKTKCESIAK